MPRKTVYKDIVDRYRQLIEDGTLQPGEELPSQREVMDEFGVSGTTVNRAFQDLKNRGLTIAKPGVGTVVAPRPKAFVTGAGRIDRLNRTGNPYAPGETSAKHRAGIRSIDDAEIANLLGVDLRDEVIIRTRVFIQDGRPKAYATSYIRLRAAQTVPEVTEDARLPQWWQKIHAERTGKQFAKLPERRCARLATPFELEMLDIEVTPDAAVPVLVLQNVFYDDEGPIEAWRDVYAPNVWQQDKD